MPEPILDAATKRRVIEEVTRMLKSFHEAEEKNEGGFESISRRGQLGGFRHALGLIIGRKATAEILATVRDATDLGFPHVGPVSDDGAIYGFDSEASLGL